MANRSIEQKKLKMKRRNRHAVFSGATTRHVQMRDVTVLDPVLKTDGTVDEDKVRIKTVRVLAGQVSLSKAVINTGRGPNHEAMQDYYRRIHSYDEALPATIGSMPIDQLAIGRRTESGLRLKDFDLAQRYSEFIKGTPKECRIRLVDNHTGVLDLYFTLNQWFFVDVDYQKKSLRRSKIYPSKAYAISMMTAHHITWVETI